jgi:hypothetical protein
VGEAPDEVLDDGELLLQAARLRLNAAHAATRNRVLFLIAVPLERHGERQER